MCGIAGFINAPGGIDQQTAWLESMTETLNRRGPDGSGLWIRDQAALGHRRLSIIDLETGSQPMCSKNETVAVVYNGEIYNFQEIRQRLSQKGMQFVTRSDTEVLINSYLMYGSECLDLFEGMFAFALWDRRSGTLFAARDRMGKKPFYFTIQNGVLAFASELTAFRKLPFIKLEIGREALARYLAYEYVPTPETIFRNVYKLQPGHFLTFHDGQLNIKKYWDLPLPSEKSPGSEKEVCEHTITLLREAVRKRLISDVPLGVFLSGGIDSSAVVALMAEEVDPKTIKTFSIGFTEASYDESKYARLVANHFGTDHHEQILSAVDAGKLLPSIVSLLDEPMSDPSIVPTYLLSQVTRRDVTVALGGDGGDELFAGYEYYSAFVLSNYYLKLPQSLRKNFIESISLKLPISTGYVSPRHVAEKFFAGVYTPEWLRTQTWLGAVPDKLQSKIWINPPEIINNQVELYYTTKRLYDNFQSEDLLNRVFYLLTKQYLLDYILVKVDRCSMMNSLEVRAPFLDRKVVEYVFGLPPWMKIRRFKRKYLLKKALRRRLPEEILHRKKRGFLIPSALWLKQTLRPLVEEMFDEGRLKRQGIFNPSAISELVTEHVNGVVDHRKELWTLLIFQLWYENNSYDIVQD